MSTMHELAVNAHQRKWRERIMYGLFLIGIIFVIFVLTLEGYNVWAMILNIRVGWAFLIGGELPITIFGIVIAAIIFYISTPKQKRNGFLFLEYWSRTFAIISFLRIFFALYY